MAHDEALADRLRELLAAKAALSERKMFGRLAFLIGWLRLEAEDVRTKRQLEKWVKLGTAYARSLPAKQR